MILDGNRRWAKNRGLQTLEGHNQGYEVLKNITEHAFDRGIKYVSAFIFSTENWNRTKKEVKYLMGFALRMSTRDLDEMHKKGIKIVWVGSEMHVGKKLVQALHNAEEKTKNNTKGTLALCFNYGGQLEIVDAVKRIVSNDTKAEDITEEMIASNLYCPSIPPIDIMIRTSGEQRISNFMLWRIAYSELYFIDKYWPDFNNKDLDDVITEFCKRQRRFGK
jgi:undecaprenyl diphosphate synthase